jgi:hypothetical protein
MTDEEMNKFEIWFHSMEWGNKDIPESVLKATAYSAWERATESDQKEPISKSVAKMTDEEIRELFEIWLFGKWFFDNNVKMIPSMELAFKDGYNYATESMQDQPAKAQEAIRNLKSVIDTVKTERDRLIELLGELTIANLNDADSSKIFKKLADFLESLAEPKKRDYEKTTEM